MFCSLSLLPVLLNNEEHYVNKDLTFIKSSKNLIIKFSKVIGEIETLAHLHISNSKIGSIEAFKTVSLLETIVLGSLKAKNNVDLNDCRVKSISMIGNLILLKSEVESIDIRGNVHLSDKSSIQLIKTSGHVKVFNSNVNSITIIKQQESKIKHEKQIVELEDSIVTDILFESEEGEVILKGSSKIKGTVIGGTIRSHKKEKVIASSIE